MNSKIKGIQALGILAALGLIVLGCLHVKSMGEKLKERSGVLIQKTEEKDKMIQMIESYAGLESRNKKLKAESTVITEEFFDREDDAELLSRLFQLFRDSGFAEKDIEVTPSRSVDISLESQAAETLPETDLVSEYQSVDASASEESPSPEMADAQVYQIKSQSFTISFKSDFQSVKRLLVLLEQQRKLFQVESLEMIPSQENLLEGIIMISVYRVPKVVMDEEFTMPVGEVAEKENPFVYVEGRSENQQEIPNEEPAVNEVFNRRRDIALIARPFQSELPAFMMGVADPGMEQFYLYLDSQEATEGSLNIREENGVVYADYQLGGETLEGGMPVISSKAGELRMEIQCFPRRDEEDRNRLNLSVNNSTSRKLVIEKYNDDKQRPRVIINKLTSNIEIK